MNSKIYSGNGVLIAAIITLVVAVLAAAVFVAYALGVGMNDTLSILKAASPVAAQITAVL